MNKKINLFKCFICISILLLLIIPTSVKAIENNLYVGYGSIDISPMISNYTEIEKKNSKMPKISECNSDNKLGTGQKAINPVPLQGYGNVTLRAKAEQCIDKDSHIKATAVAFKDSSNNYVVLLSADLIAFYTSLTNKSDFTVDKIRESIVSYVKSNAGIELKANRIMLSSTHNHSAPSFMYDSDNIRAYDNFLKRRLNEVVLAAIKDIKKATITYDTLKIFLDENGNVTQYQNYSGKKKYLSFVRHYVTDNYVTASKKPVVNGVGRGVFGLKCTDSSYKNCSNEYTYAKVTGHTREADYDMQVLKINFSDSTIKPILMLNWQSHPVVQGGAQQLVITADFIGYLRGYLEEKKYRVSYYQGAAADINNYTSIASESISVDGQNISVYSSDVSKAKKSAKVMGRKMGELVDTRIKSGNFFKKKVDYKNGIVFYQETNKTEANSNLIQMNLRNWNNKDSSGKYIYDIDTYANAYFINMLIKIATNDINNGSNYLKRMINGELTLNEWKSGLASSGKWNYVDQSGKSHDFKFPKILGTSVESASTNLISIIRKYNTSLFKDMFKFEKNNIGIYKLVGYNNLNISTISNLISLLGTMMDDVNTSKDESICNHSHASILLSIYKQTKSYYNPILNTFAIGNIGFVTAPYEMFSSNGKYIKQNSPYNMTFVLAYSNGGYYGYVPDKETFKYKSYETDITLFVEGTAEKNATTLVNRLKNIYNKEATTSTASITTKDSNITIKDNKIRIKISKNYTLTYGNIKNRITISSSTSKYKTSSGNIVSSDNEILGTGSKIQLDNKEYTIIVNGDGNKDGKVTSVDYITIRNHILGKNIINKNDVSYEAIDVNSDNKITSADYIMLKKIIIGG